MGQVYLAKDDRLGRLVAIKLISAEHAGDPERRSRFLLEARSASGLNHANVCVVHEIGETADGRPFIAMEYVQGRVLDELVREGPVAVAQAVDIARQIADALDAAHSAGIVHRDVKPGNVMVDGRGRAKVLDFGLAKRIDAAADAQAARMTQAGTVLGSPAYMSPEQVLARPVDHRSDLFGLGALLYELLTGHVPFEGTSLGDTFRRLLSDAPAAIAARREGVPPELERVVLKLLAKDPGGRFQSARDVFDALTEVSRTLPRTGDSARATAAPPPTASARGRDAGPGTVTSSLAVAAAQAASVQAEPARIADSDVVIAYAELDDVPLTEGGPGWISRLHRNLELRVAQLSGGAKVQRVSATTTDGAAFEDVVRCVPEAKSVVSVLSPVFAHSDGCARVVEAFWRHAERTGRFRVGDAARIIHVVKSPVDPEDLPQSLAPLYAGLRPYEFFERDPATGRVREFDEALGEVYRQRFYERVYDVAFDVSQLLRQIRAPVASASGAERRAVFLATTTSDLEPQRDQLRRQLVEWGYAVLPRQALPVAAEEIRAVVRACLAQCELSIHCVGAHYGLVPEGTDRSVVAIQHDAARDLGGATPLARIVWTPRGLAPADPRQRGFLAEIEAESGPHAELIADSLENLKTHLDERRKRRAPSGAGVQAAGAGSPPRIYVLCDRQDEAAVEPLEDLLLDLGIEVALPAFDADEHEAQEIHIRNLRDCDAALIFFGAGGRHWADFSIRDLEKAAGYRDGRPIPVSAVWVAPPFDRRKERFRSVACPVLRSADGTPDAAVLAPFVDATRASREQRRA